MRILIDLQACQSETSQFSETGRCSMSLALAIARNAAQHNIWIVLNDRVPDSALVIRQAFSGLLPKENIVTFSIPPKVAEATCREQWLIRASELIREFFIAILQPDIVHISNLFEGWEHDAVTSIGDLPCAHIATSATLYNLLPLLQPNTYLADPTFRDYYYRKIDSLKKSDLLLSVSDNSRREAIDLLDVSPSRIVTISATAEPVAKLQEAFWNDAARTAIEAFEELTSSQRRQRRQSSISAKQPSYKQSCEQAYQSLISGISKLKGISNQLDADLVSIANSIAINVSFPQKQLLIDLSAMVECDLKTGIQRVVRSILTQISNYPPESYTITPVYWDGEYYRQANQFISQILPDSINSRRDDPIADDIVDVSCNDIFLGLDFEIRCTLNSEATLRRFRDLGAEIYYVVYDILLIQHPEWFPKEDNPLFKLWLSVISELSTGLVCISQATANAVEDWMLKHQPNRIDPLKVDYFHLGADISQSLPSGGLPKNAESVVRVLKAIPTILMVSTVEPRKGHTQVLHAFNLLWQSEIMVNLVIVGKCGWQVDDLVKQLNSHPERNRRLFWLQGISDEYLEKLYSVSTALLAASEGEGFGLPLIEAAQHHLPIIARSLPVFHEVAGEHAFYFEGNQPEQLANAIKTWLALNKEGKAPVSTGMPWSTWRESTQQLLKTILPLP